jgi:hypothetical protein
MRQFWSMRSNKRQHTAQTLRFEWSIKREIIRIARGNGIHFLGFLGGSDGGSKGAKRRSGGKSCIQDLSSRITAKEDLYMAETVVKLRLNQQQLELMDRTIAQGVAPDRVSLVRLALREYAATRKADAAVETSR